MSPDRLWLNSHLPQTFEVVQTLKYHSAFKNEQHAKRHESEVPVLVEEPQRRCKQLEDKEWRNHVFFVKVEEIRNWNRHFIWSINQVHLLESLLILNTFCLLVVAYQVLGWVVDRVESLLGALVNEFLFLDFQLERLADFVFDCHLLHYQRRDEVLHCVLLDVAHGDADVRAGLNFVVLEVCVGVELVRCHRPIVEQNQHSIDKNS